jgi:hypothetical protein
MLESIEGLCLLLLVFGTGFMIHNSMKWAKERRASTGLIDDRLGTLATLIDEALDMFSDITGDSPVASTMSHQSFDIKEMLTGLVMSKLMPDPQHGSTQGQEGAIQEENDTPEAQTEDEPR